MRLEMFFNEAWNILRKLVHLAMSTSARAASEGSWIPCRRGEWYQQGHGIGMGNQKCHFPPHSQSCGRGCSGGTNYVWTAVGVCGHWRYGGGGSFLLPPHTCRVILPDEGGSLLYIITICHECMVKNFPHQLQITVDDLAGGVVP